MGYKDTYANNIAALYGQLGQAQAAGRLGSGQAWANAFGQVGQTLAAIPGQLRQDRLDTQREAFNAKQMEVIDANLRRAAQQEQDDQWLKDAIASSLTPEGEIDERRATENLQLLGAGHLVPDIKKTMMEVRRGALALQEAELQGQLTQANVTQFIDQTVAPVAMRIKEADYDPAVIAAAMADLERYDILKPLVAQFRTTTLGDPEQLKAFIDDYAAKYVPAKGNFVNVSEGSKIVDTSRRGPDGQAVVVADNPKRVSWQRAPIMVDGKPMMANFDPDKGAYYKPGTNELITGDIRPVPAASAAGTPKPQLLSENGLDYIATQYRLTRDGSILTRFSDEEKARVINRVAEQNEMLGRSPVNAIMQQLSIKADAASLSNVTKMGDAVKAAESKALGQADIITGLLPDVSRTNIRKLDEWLSAGRRNIEGNTPEILLYNAIQTFSNEYGKIVEGSTGSVQGASESSMKAARSLINAAMKGQTITDVLNLMKREMALTGQGWEATRDLIQGRIVGGVGGSGGGETQKVIRYDENGKPIGGGG